MDIYAVAALVEHAESRGEWYAQNGCHRGVMQVCTRWSRYPASWLWVPALNREEGRRLLAYWHRRAGGDWHRAVAAYRCGWGGLTGKCGARYAAEVLK